MANDQKANKASALIDNMRHQDERKSDLPLWEKVKILEEDAWDIARNSYKGKEIYNALMANYSTQNARPELPQMIVLKGGEAPLEAFKIVMHHLHSGTIKLGEEKNRLEKKLEEKDQQIETLSSHVDVLQRLISRMNGLLDDRDNRLLDALSSNKHS